MRYLTIVFALLNQSGGASAKRALFGFAIETSASENKQLESELDDKQIAKLTKTEKPSIKRALLVMTKLKNFKANLASKGSLVQTGHGSKPPPSDEEKAVLMNMFKSHDKDGDGLLDRSEMQALFDSIDVDQDANHLIFTHGNAESGTLSFNDFLAAYASIPEIPAEVAWEEAGGGADGEGSLDMEKFGTWFKTMDPNATDAEIETLFNDIDAESNGTINFDEFKIAMGAH